MRLETGEPGTSLASDGSARERERALRRDFARLLGSERRRTEERREREPSVVVDWLRDDVEDDEDEEDEPVDESSESELEEELEPSPKKARKRAMVMPRPEPEEELEELPEDDKEDEEDEEPLELSEAALPRAELRLPPRLLREPRRERERRAFAPGRWRCVLRR